MRRSRVGNAEARVGQPPARPFDYLKSRVAWKAGNKIQSSNNALQDSLSFSAPVCEARYLARICGGARNPRGKLKKMEVVSCSGNSRPRRRARERSGRIVLLYKGDRQARGFRDHERARGGRQSRLYKAWNFI